MMKPKKPPKEGEDYIDEEEVDEEDKISEDYWD